jgi:hypothetical protein
MGASLRAYRIAGALQPALVMVALKLVVCPLAVWALATLVFEMPPLWAKVAIVLAAMPVGVNVYLFAARYDAGQAERCRDRDLERFLDRDLAARAALLWRRLRAPARRRCGSCYKMAQGSHREAHMVDVAMFHRACPPCRWSLSAGDLILRKGQTAGRLFISRKARSRWSTATSGSRSRASPAPCSARSACCSTSRRWPMCGVGALDLRRGRQGFSSRPSRGGAARRRAARQAPGGRASQARRGAGAARAARRRALEDMVDAVDRSLLAPPG